MKQKTITTIENFLSEEIKKENPGTSIMSSRIFLDFLKHNPLHHESFVDPFNVEFGNELLKEICSSINNCNLNKATYLMGVYRSTFPKRLAMS